MKSLGFWLESLGIHFAARRRHQGLHIAVLAPVQGNEGELVSRTLKAVDLIATHAPRNLMQAQRHLRLIWVRRYPLFRAAFAPERRACILDTGFVGGSNTTIDAIAASIVHETTHARIAHWGVPYDDVRRARIERICRRAELDFAARLPDGQDVAARATEILALDDHDIAMTSAAQSAAALEAAKLQVAELPLPRILRQWLIAYLARRRAA